MTGTQDANSAWLSLVAGTQVDVPELTTLEEVIAFRTHPTRDLRKHNVDLPPDVEIRHETLRELNGVATKAEVYVPSGSGPFPMLLYMHGGGWCWGKAEYVRKLGMSMAERGHVVVNLDYGLAPELPFPWAVEETIHAARWMTENAERLGGAPGPIAIGGASAGANLAAAAIVALTHDDAPAGELSDVSVEFSAAVFLYGIFDLPLLMQRPGSHAGGFAETLYNSAYLGPHWLTLHRHPLVSPAHAPNLDRFPPTYLTIGDQDALVPQSLGMAARLIDAGVPTTLSLVEGLNHSFAYIPHHLPDAATELQRLFGWLESRTTTRSEQ
ncbi:MAG: acetyl esterase [Thermoleophilaceae bacterium]|nr:acetyl esterase [Thermoleophilaceae bacterium]